MNGCVWKQQRRSSIAIWVARAIQADINFHRGIGDDHLAALLQVARRRALEPIILEDVEVELVAADPLPNSD
jgi:hypothetical protein